MKGIDVSAHQGVIDWAKVAKAGIEFAIIRAGYCEYGGALVVDKQLDANMKGAANAGLKIGAYLFSYAKTAQAGTTAAGETASALGGYSLALPVYFDMEDSSALSYTSMSKSENAAIANAFITAIAAAGYKPGFYSYKSFLENNINALASGASVWVAQWADKCTYGGNYDVWQYSATGKVDGISGNVDLDECYASFGEGTKADSSAGAPAVDEGKADYIEYKVIKNDTLTGIAAKHGVPLNQLIKTNPQIKNPNLIYVGDTVRVPCKIDTLAMRV